MKTRQDAWTEEHDLLLAKTVLRHIEEGSTQLKAFDEVGDILNRTSAACGFRWNAHVRNAYEDALRIAKKQRKQRKRLIPNQPGNKTVPMGDVIDVEYAEEISPSQLSMHEVIHYLQTFQQDTKETIRVQMEHDVLRREHEALKEKYEQLCTRCEQLTKQQANMQEDYQHLVRIMDRARRMVVEDETQPQLAPIFTTDKHGNLEIM